ncbi:peptidylprolyl isomerase [Phenylobacterium sp.]|uniref:peptidylprolyl isomerase n=1 Tax=Phenylobacterium sp. TaxID=1871053 RepID=UPI0025EF7922|nr:peptidylprolyl isomerase [Phenylobacterium sp.]
MHGLRRALAEPLVQFLLIGAVLFVGLSAVRAAQKPVVRIEAQDLNQLATYWEAQMQRPPNKVELAGIIRDRIDEELLAREALRLGLDKDDMIIRRRLAQKMSFATEDLAAAEEPTEAQLRAYFTQHADRYAAAAHVSFRQVFFSGDRPHGQAEQAARQALGMSGETKRDPSGDPFFFPLAYDGIATRDLERDYGQAFVQALERAPVGEWSGPVMSPYGWHLIEVTSRTPAPPTSFESVRDHVREAWIDERRTQANAEFMQSLRKRYKVIVAGVPEA